MPLGAWVLALTQQAAHGYTVSLVDIKFNHNTGSETADGVTIRTKSGTTITAPEWTSSRNDPVAFTMSSSKTIKVKFTCTDADAQDVPIWADKTGGNRLGDIGRVLVDFSGGSSGYVSFTLATSDVGSTIRQLGTVTWTWKYGSGYTMGTTGPHKIYTLYSAPTAPEADPRVHILGYACKWADGDANISTASRSILSGMADHYDYTDNCFELSSDFVRLVRSIGGNAVHRRWARGAQLRQASYYQMTDQTTIPVDPVGSTYGLGALRIGFHQWGEVATGTRDPSFNLTLGGNWTDYEDYLYDSYEYCNMEEGCDTEWPDFAVQQNQSGQSIGCEDYQTTPHRAQYDSCPLIHDWTGF